MIELRRAIELGDDRGQLDPETPFIGAAAHLFDRSAPPIPPAGHEPRDWFDDEQPIAPRSAFKQALHEPVAGRVREFVQRERCEDHCWSFGQRD